MKISYKGAAVQDIKEKQIYISEQLKNKSAAKKLTMSILHAVALLADNPRMGTPLSSRYDVNSDLRYLIVSKQLIFYRIVDDSYISVIRVIDGRQDYMALLFGE